MLSITPVMLDSEVGIMTRSGDEVREIVFRFPTGARDNRPQRIQNDADVHQASYPVVASNSFPRAKRLEREAEHSVRSRPKLSTQRNCTCISS